MRVILAPPEAVRERKCRDRHSVLRRNGYQTRGAAGEVAIAGTRRRMIHVASAPYAAVGQAYPQTFNSFHAHRR